MKITKKAKGIILVGAVAITISTAVVINGGSTTSTGNTMQKAVASVIDPPGG